MLHSNKFPLKLLWYNVLEDLLVLHLHEPGVYNLCRTRSFYCWYPWLCSQNLFINLCFHELNTIGSINNGATNCYKLVNLWVLLPECWRRFMAMQEVFEDKGKERWLDEPTQSLALMRRERLWTIICGTWETEGVKRRWRVLCLNQRSQKRDV